MGKGRSIKVYNKIERSERAQILLTNVAYNGECAVQTFLTLGLCHKLSKH